MKGKQRMSAKTTDPLAGIPVATAGPAKTKAAAVPAGVINLASAKKKRRLSGQDYQDAKKFAQSMVGYDSSSPIWGKRQPVILGQIIGHLNDVEASIGVNSDLDAARVLVQELQKRVAFGQVMKAQS